MEKNDNQCEKERVAMLLKQGRIDLEMNDLEDYF